MEREPKPLPEGWMRAAKGRTVRIPVNTPKKKKQNPKPSPKLKKEKTYKVNYESLENFELKDYAPKNFKKKSEKKIIDSFGEKVIREFLDSQKVYYVEQAMFDALVNPKTNQPLRFDFYLPNQNLCIEFDGKQHFTASYDFHGKDALKKLKEQKERDSIKTNFCKVYNIKLLRITYKQYDRIEKILAKTLTL